MIIKTQAIVLNVHPFSETSHVVSWLTCDHGRISTIVKGALRPRNFFLGQYDLFYTCELLCYMRLFQGLHIVKECFPLKSRQELRDYWLGAACASYFTGLAAKVTHPYAPQRGIYALLDAALDFFAGKSGRTALPGSKPSDATLETGLYWFEMKLLELMGFSPSLQACLLCRRPLLPAGTEVSDSKEKRHFAFSTARGGALCGACHAKHKADSVLIAADTLALLRFWQSSRQTNAIFNTVCSERQTGDIGAVLGGFLQHHLETENAGRKIALSILRKRVAKWRWSP